MTVRRALASSVALVLAVLGLGAVGGAAPALAAVPSSTSVTVNGSSGPEVVVGYGQPVVAAARVTVAVGAPDGWVFFVVDGVSRRADLAPDGTATTTFEGLRAGSHAVFATFVPRDPSQQDGSTSATVAVQVVKVSTKPRVRVSGSRVGRVAHVHLRVRTPYGTTPSGRVTATLRRRGTPGQRVRGAVLEDGRAGIRVGRLAAGRYRVVVRYRGDANHLPSRQGQVFRVRRS